MAEWIERSLSCFILVVGGMPLGNALYPHYPVPQRGLKLICPHVCALWDHRERRQSLPPHTYPCSTTLGTQTNSTTGNTWIRPQKIFQTKILEVTSLVNHHPVKIIIFKRQSYVSVLTFILIMIVYECIVNVFYVNPANDSIWNTLF